MITPQTEPTPSDTPPKEIVWLFTHCLALGMTKKSDSGKLEHDIALFVIDLEWESAKLREELEQLQAHEAERERLRAVAVRSFAQRAEKAEQQLAEAQKRIEGQAERILSLEHLHKQVNEHHFGARQLHTNENAALRSQLAEAQADSRRYEWIRSKLVQGESIELLPHLSGHPLYSHITPDKLDTAIDTAIGATHER